MLAELSNDAILKIGLGAQAICAVGVFAAGRWRWLFLFIVALPVFWALPFILASAHCAPCLDGVVVLPVIFLGILVFAKFRSPAKAAAMVTDQGGKREI